MIHFARSNLARELAEQLQGKQVFNDAYNGLFLAAPHAALAEFARRANAGPCSAAEINAALCRCLPFCR